MAGFVTLITQLVADWLVRTGSRAMPCPAESSQVARAEASARSRIGVTFDRIVGLFGDYDFSWPTRDETSPDGTAVGPIHIEHGFVSCRGFLLANSLRRLLGMAHVRALFVIPT